MSVIYFPPRYDRYCLPIASLVQPRIQTDSFLLYRLFKSFYRFQQPYRIFHRTRAGFRRATTPVCIMFRRHTFLTIGPQHAYASWRREDIGCRAGKLVHQFGSNTALRPGSSAGTMALLLKWRGPLLSADRYLHRVAPRRGSDPPIFAASSIAVRPS